MTVLLRTDTSHHGRHELLADSPGEPPWWMPALVHLALVRDDLSDVARSTLTAWAGGRSDLFYTVVQEETDDHLSLTASSWPLVDDRGRLRFDTVDDPVEFHAERHELQAFVDAHRASWRSLGLVGPELAQAPVRLGDTFAMGFQRPNGRRVRLDSDPLRRSTVPAEVTLEPARPATAATTAAATAASSSSTLPTMRLIEDTRSAVNPGGRRRRIAMTDGPVVDITWDARQAGKVAQLAAFAGVLDPSADAGASSADLALIDEGIDRQLRAFTAGLGPDEALALDGDGDGDAAAPG